jgi:hypothetical protein
MTSTSLLQLVDNLQQAGKIRNLQQVCGVSGCVGITLQSDCKFNEHVKRKLMKANKCLHVLKTLRKEQYNQSEIDHLFRSLVLPNITYGLSIYGASESDLKVVQRFLDRCYKRSYMSFPIRVLELLQKQDTKIFNTVTTSDDHPLTVIIPKKKEVPFNLRKKRCLYPKTNTQRFKTTFVNRLIFKYNLV